MTDRCKSEDQFGKSGRDSVRSTAAMQSPPPRTPSGLGNGGSDRGSPEMRVSSYVDSRPIYSRSEFPEYEDDRELFDTFTYP